MSDDKDRGTRAANERGPTAEPYVTGISKIVRSELGKLHPELERKIIEHVGRKGGGDTPPGR
jgi:actin-like ATPase involved in cell morphogenesis